MTDDRDQSQHSDAADAAEGRKDLTTAEREVVASRWATNPDQAVNWATIPYVDLRAAAMAGATDPGKGFWLHMLDLYSDPARPVRRALSLACGLGHQERTLARYRKFDECDAFDISPGALEKARQSAEAEGLHNINYECRDLNDLKLTHQYDIVIAGGVHHIRNLENLFSEVSKNLAEGGLFLMYEYIGPSQCQPTARQLEAINACIRLLPTKYRVRISAQRKLGVNTPGEALAAIEAQRAAARAAASEGPTTRPALEPVAPGVEKSNAESPADADEGRREPLAEPARRGVPRFLELLGRAAAAIRRGDFFFRLRMFMVRCLQPSTTPDPRVSDEALESGAASSSNVDGQDPSAVTAPTPTAGVPGSGASGGQSETVAGTTDGADAGNELPDEYFWSRFVPMTREQWNAVDPSESVRSDEIIPLLKQYFKAVDVRYTGGSIMQFTLYDIAGNFYDDNEETRDLLDMLFKIEEVLVKHDDVPQDYAVIVAKND